MIVLLSAEIVEFDGQPCVLTVAEDITERKQAELARTDLSRRLMTAQEAERRRIARELHDGIGQALALLSVQLQRAGPPSSEGKKPPTIGELCAKAKDIGVQGEPPLAPTAFLRTRIPWAGCCSEEPVPRIRRPISHPGQLHML